jgi:hypothetical protein
MSSFGTVGRSSTGPDGAASIRDGTIARMFGTAVGTVGTASNAPAGTGPDVGADAGTAAGVGAGELVSACAASWITGDGSLGPRVGRVGPVSGLCPSPRGRGTGTLSVGTPSGVPLATTSAGLDDDGIADGGGVLGALPRAGPGAAGASGDSAGIPIKVFCASRFGRSFAVAGDAPPTPAAAPAGRASRNVGGAGARCADALRTVVARSTASRSRAFARWGASGGRTAPGPVSGSSTHAGATSARDAAGVPACTPSGTRWRGTGGGTSAPRCSTMWASSPLPRWSRRTYRTLAVPPSSVTTASPSSTATFDASATTTRICAPFAGPPPVTGTRSRPSAVAKARKPRTTSSTVVQRLTRRHAVPSATAFECRQFLRV